MSLFHIDYFELKSVEKQQMRKALCFPHFNLKTDHKISHVPGREEHSYYQRLVVSVKMNLYKHTKMIFIFHYFPLYIF